MNFFAFVLLLFVDLFRGSKKSPSIFGIKPCSAGDWTSLGIYAAVSISLTIYAIKVTQYEQYLKIKLGQVGLP